MPTFYDITGLEDEEGELQAEMLSIFFNGKLKEREEVNSVGDYCVKNERNIHRLRQLYNKRPVKTRVDRIIVVCTANRIRNLPVSLLSTIRETASRGSRGNVNMRKNRILKVGSAIIMESKRKYKYLSPYFCSKTEYRNTKLAEMP